METLALPLRLDKETGVLVRTDRVTALLAVMRAMAAAPASSWAHAPWFGLQQVFEGANLQREDQHDIQEALNRGLDGLGVTWASVTFVKLLKAGQKQGERRFEITLRLGDGQVVHRPLNV